MDVLFLNANILFSAAYRSNAGLRRIWDLEEVEIISSEYAVEEARRNLSEGSQQERLDRLLRMTRIVPESSARVYEPGSPILAAAVGGRATHLLTGDVTHFGHLLGRKVGDVAILTPSQYLARRLGESREAE